MFHIFITLQMPLSGANSTEYLTITYLIVFHYGFLYMHTPGFSYVCHTVRKYKFPARREFDVVGNFRSTV
jgi:hypothetical protein